MDNQGYQRPDAQASIAKIECTAAHCKYHHPGGSCSAGNIKVGATAASCKSETFCNTFVSCQSC